MLDSERLQAALGRLRHAGALPGTADTLDRAGLLADTRDDVLASVEAYSASRNPALLPALDAHLEQHADTIRQLLLDARAPGLVFVTEHARQSAAEKFPLDALLKTYRVLNRVLADRLRDAAIDAADERAELRQVVAATASLAIEYTGLAASLATTEYVAETRRLAEAEGDRRSELLGLLLEGYDESDARAAGLLRRSGYLEQRQTYCVVAVRAVNAGEMDNVARVQRIEETLKDVLRRAPVRALVGTRDNFVVAVVSATRRQSGYTRPHTVVSEIITTPLRTLGNAVLTGVSGDVPSTSYIRAALGEAEQALGFASLARRVVHAGQIPFTELIVQVARERVRSSLPAWVPAFIEADRRGKLAATLSAYADQDMNAQRTAKALGVHANTVYARFEKIASLTGQDPQRFRQLGEMLMAIDVARESG
ncbi:MAG: helix-turn-helix domain-containing protein [Pseudomonadota bacterium]